MKKQSHTFIMGSFALFAIYLYYLSATPLPPQLKIKEVPSINAKMEEQNALQYLNTLRVGAGLVPFKSHPQLNKAAKNHAEYLTNHLTYGHTEEKKYKDYTGKFASSRVIHVGYSSPQIIENVSTHNPNYKESINGLFSAIYHRLAFLDARADAIGIGISQNKLKKSQTAFVYDMSSQALEKLYKYDKNITSQDINKVLDQNKRLNKKVIIYPFNQQKEVPPAFFDELPDPLPEYRVSGFPISISFNSLYYKKAELLKFQIFNSEGIQLKNTLTFDKKTDPNKRLGELDFVMFPLNRLDWNTKYYIKFSALVDKKVLHKEWSFHTQSFNFPLHIVGKRNLLYKMKKSQAHIFYFPPNSKVDLLRDIAYPSNVDIEFIDKNTIKLIGLASSPKQQRLSIGKHKINIKIEEK